MNDRSKDCAPRGTLRGSWGSWTATLSHTVGTRHQLVVVQGFFYVLGCLFWWHADLGGLGVGKGKSAGSHKARRQWTQATYTHVSTNHRTVSHSSMVCSHCIAQTYACLLRSSFSGYRRSSFLLGRCALGLLCSHAPTERVPGLNACPWLPVEGGTGSKSQVSHMHPHSSTHQFYTRHAQPARRRSRLLFMEFGCCC